MMNFPVNMWKIREITDKVTNVVMNYTEVETKVREATNDEPWGPTGPLMGEIAQYTYTYEHFPEVMGMLWKRMLQDTKKYWRQTYKSLLLLSYLVRNGSERVVTSAREHIYDLRRLENYQHIDELGKDQGVNVRQKVKDLIDFIQDDDRLREERKKAKKNKDKYIGLSGGEGRYGDRWDDSQWRGSSVGGGMRSQFSDMDSWKEPSTVEKIESKIRETLNIARGRTEDQPDVSNEDDDFKYDSDNGWGQGRREYCDDEDSWTQSRSENSSPAKRPNTKAPKKLDLGAAASFSSSEGRTRSPTKSAVVDEVESPPTSKPQASAKPSAIDLLGDLEGNSAFTQVSADPFISSKSAATENGEFGDFSQFSSGATTTKATDDFADFSAFQSQSTQPSTSAGQVAQQSTAQQVAVQPNFQSQQFIGQNLGMPMQPGQSSMSMNPTQSMMMSQPVAQTQQGVMTAQPSVTPMHQGMMTQPSATPMPQGMVMTQPSVVPSQPAMVPQSGIPTTPQGMMLSQEPRILSQQGLVMQSKGMMAQQNSQGMVSVQQQGMMPTAMDMHQMGQGGGLQPRMLLMNTSASYNKPNTWSNVGINISLDSLSNPGSQYQKQQQPSMNQLRSPPQGLPPTGMMGVPQQQATASPVNQQQGFANFSGL
ncbi:PREDICTED: clathrin interactor 1-like isoform X2 [Priapulus caudatus]|uniref:Clathrin interactor 1-like isoform X2 n=1 Tax=Priapulus caudatus TaxID=37621 RepID=A0ABM1DS31_PRICU|nr:PREDICTED: clathrin interactor 1-like isoform X2 [Priapulus caudatus]